MISNNLLIIRAYRAAHKRGMLIPYLKTVGAYTSGLWRAVREFYNSGDVSGFIDTFNYWINEQLPRAWREGSIDVGVYPEEWEQEDKDEIQRIINGELDFVLGFAEDIETARKEGSGYEKFRGRVDAWANRYTDVVNQARVWFGSRQKLEWVRGPTSDGCTTCKYLDGIVAWGKEWDKADVKPQRPPNSKINCGGWECLCELLPTDKRRTPNALDKIMNAPKSDHHHQETK